MTGQLAGAGGCDGAGGGGGFGQLPSAVSDVIGTPAARMDPACALMHAPSCSVSSEGTPAITKGVASATTHVVHASAGFEHLLTAAEKSCGVVIEQVGGGSGDGKGGGGGGGDGVAQVASAASDAGLTPSAVMKAACALMQAPSEAVSVEATPCKMKGIASATLHVLQALAVVAQGETAAVKLCCADTGHVAAGGGEATGGGGGRRWSKARAQLRGGT